MRRKTRERKLRRPGRATVGLVMVGMLLLAAAGPLTAQEAVANPHGTLPEGLDCSACHTAEGWRSLRTPLAFDHAERTGFALSGAHAQAPCAGCHLDLRFDEPKVASDDCASCHADVHEGRMVQECAACHNTRSFQEVDGELIHARTSFPLTGAHRQITCESCHTSDVGGAYTSLDTDCVSCHEADYQGAQTVDHVASGYPTDCTQCHTTLGWSDAPAFDHETISGGFALVGAHTGLRCASCHQVPGMEPLFSPSSQNDCVACHQADYDRQHGGGNFPTTCLDCHTVDSWEGADFDHALAGFPLEGRHATLSCSACHTDNSGGLKFTAPTSPTDCVACHQSDYDGAHAGSSIPTTCATCHTQTSWEGAGLNHTQISGGFELVGSHATAPCTDCHTIPSYALLFPEPASQDDCASCHQAEYDANHGGSAIPTTCAGCHSETTWSGATLDHAALPGGFALTGPHATITCTACHAVPDYALLFPAPAGQDDCVACHQADYDREHAGSDFPTTCLSCHSATTWSGATFDHAQVAGGFQLEGSHATAQCTACHVVPGYGLLFPQPSSQNDCLACHQTQYDGAHGGTGMPTDCMACHNTTAWTPSSFDHDAQYFPIYSGAHQTVWSSCATCHTAAGDLSSFSCIDCHDHGQAVTDEHHQSVNGYVYESGACYSCHPRGRS